MPALAQPSASKSAATPEPSFAAQAAALQQQIDESTRQMRQLVERRDLAEGVAARVFDRRVEAAALNALSQAQQLVELVIAQQAAGEDPGAFQKTASGMLRAIPERLRAYANQLLAASETGKSLESMTAVEQIALEAEREQLSNRLLIIFQALVRNLELSDQLGLDTTEQIRFLTEALTDSAANQSVALELAREREPVLARQVKALPEDKELAALTRVNGERINRLNDDLRQLVAMMETLGLPVTHYRQQVVTAAGTVTTDILDLEVIKGLVAKWLQTAGLWAKTNLPGILFKLLLFLLIVWAALAIAGITRRLVERGLNRTPTHLSQLAERMLISSAGNLVLLLGILFGLAQLDISVGPMLAGLGIAGFIVGFALQDTLGNFASGMLILMYRPYDVGDFIETNGVLGKVSHMSMVNTTVLTIDNQTLVLPNSKIWGDVIKNVTAQRERRVDMVFGISYRDDIARAEQVLNDIVQRHSKVLEEPEAVIRLHKLGESSVDFVVRPWVKTEDYWDVYWDITRTVKMRFDEEGITIPFPQRDVHFFSGRDNSARAETAVLQEQAPVAPTGNRPLDVTESDDGEGHTT